MNAISMLMGVGGSKEGKIIKISDLVLLQTTTPHSTLSVCGYSLCTIAPLAGDTLPRFPPIYRSLGVALWELFELGRQPYETYSDRQVLSYVIKEQQLKLPKPQLKQLQSDRW